MMSASMPRREAMFRALDLPGMPHMRRYVGASLASSNSTLAFSKRPSWYLREVSELHAQQDVSIACLADEWLTQSCLLAETALLLKDIHGGLGCQSICAHGIAVIQRGLSTHAAGDMHMRYLHT